MQNFTLDDFASFSQKESKWLNELTNAMQQTMRNTVIEPSREVVKRVSDYNKAYSSRPSIHVKRVEMLLN